MNGIFPIVREEDMEKLTPEKYMISIGKYRYLKKSYKK